MNKKLILVALSALTILASCGGSSEGGSNSNGGVFAKFDGELERNVTIKILDTDQAKKSGFLQESMKEFNEAYKEYGIKAVDANIDAYGDLAQNGPYGFGPDVIFNAHDQIMKYVAGKHVTPLPMNKIPDLDQYPEEALKAYRSTIGGNEYTFGVPFFIQTPMLLYRQDALPEDWKTTLDKDQDGRPDMFETWNSLYSWAKKVKEDSNGKQLGFMYSMQSPYFSSGYLISNGAYYFGNNDTDTKDIGFSNGESWKGAKMIKDLSTLMDETCQDNSASSSNPTNLAKKKVISCLITPDVYENYVKSLALEYESKGMNKEEAKKKAKENLVLTVSPEFPVSGDITNPNETEFKPTRTMGGISGYGISSYTKYPVASLEFIKFCSTKAMALKRHELEGIAPVRNDAASEIGGLSNTLFNLLKDKTMYIMPSNDALPQAWGPLQNAFTDLAIDAFRKDNQVKYKEKEDFVKLLEKVDQDIYDAINTLK